MPAITDVTAEGLGRRRRPVTASTLNWIDLSLFILDRCWRDPSATSALSHRLHHMTPFGFSVALTEQLNDVNERVNDGHQTNTAPSSNVKLAFCFLFVCLFGFYSSKTTRFYTAMLECSIELLLKGRRRLNCPVAMTTKLVIAMGSSVFSFFFFLSALLFFCFFIYFFFFVFLFFRATALLPSVSLT